MTGYIKTIRFADGDIVKEGDALFEIDPEPYEAALKNADANLAKAKADIATADAVLARANTDYDRGVKLQQSKSLSIEDFDLRKSARDSAVADLQAKKALAEAAEATLRKAAFDRRNCVIRSEVKGVGRISRTLLTKGNLVTSGQTLLCKVTSLDPIHAFWDVDEMTSLMYRRQIEKKQVADPRETSMDVQIGLKDEEGFLHQGKVDYIDPEIRRVSGSREIRGIFQNPGYRLSPGDSVRVRLESGIPKQYITVPEIAVGSQQQQKFVYVVVKDKEGKNIVEFRPVTTGAVRSVGAQRLQIIEQGLQPGEVVIVNGLLRVRPGMEVKTKEMPATVSKK